MHPNYWQITILLVVDLCSSLACFMMTQPFPIAGKLPIKTLVAKQLPTNMCVCVCTHTHTHTHTQENFCQPISWESIKRGQPQTIHIYGPESGVASHAALRSSNVIILNVLFRKPINFHFFGSRWWSSHNYSVNPHHSQF